MRIPLEHLASTVPIFSLSSSQVPVEDQLAPKSIKDRFFGSGVTRSGERRVSIGSAPTSPAFQRKMAMSMLVESHDELRPGNLTANQMLSSSLTSFDHTAIDNEYGMILMIFCLYKKGSPVICQVYLLSMCLKSVCKKSLHTRKSMYQKSICPKVNVSKVNVSKRQCVKSQGT